MTAVLARLGAAMVRSPLAGRRVRPGRCAGTGVQAGRVCRASPGDLVAEVYGMRSMSPRLRRAAGRRSSSPGDGVGGPPELRRSHGGRGHAEVPAPPRHQPAYPASGLQAPSLAAQRPTQPRRPRTR
jgi:hypothetical protein